MNTETQTTTMEEVACGICGQFSDHELFVAKDEFYGLPGLFSLKLCAKCDLVYISPRPVPGEIGRYYPVDYYSYLAQDELPSVRVNPNLWQKAQLKKSGYSFDESVGWAATLTLWIYKFIREDKLRIGFRPFPCWQPGGSLLDIGCGTGFYLAEMKKLGWDVQGVEYSKQAAMTGQSLYEVPIAVGSLADTDFPDESFDVITMWETLEHVPYPQETLSRIWRLLRRGGVFIGSVPNRRSFYAPLFGKAYFPLEIPRHLYHFSSNSLKLLAKNAGFKQIRIQSVSLGASNLILSWGIKKNRQQGKSGLEENFWQGKQSLLRTLTWGLKPFHKLIDVVGKGMGLEFEFRKE